MTFLKMPWFVLQYNTRLHVTFPNYGRPAALGECAVENKVPFTRKVRLPPSVNSSITTSSDLRAEFLSYFKEKGHVMVAPSSVYPRRLEGSYFINAGMNQFKPLFLRNQICPSNSDLEFSRLTRAVNSQPCIRIGGRHDDLNDVGYDTCHHTMFEMLGNWSFGDYGKETACRQMWQFLTDVLGLPPSCLYVTYFGGCEELALPADDETRDIWLDIGISDQKLVSFGAESNFWRADQGSGGGLCGPSTEIHVDFAALSGRGDPNCARCMVNAGDARVVELWNCVFITHRMVEEAGSRIGLVPLPCLSVDTGMGLERLASVMQGTMTTYDTDAFLPLLNFIHSEAQRITSNSVPSYSSQYILPELSEDNSSNPLVGRTIDQEATAKPSRLSNILRAFALGHRDSATLPATKARPIMSDGGPVDYETLHRDIAYRLVADHSRALSVAMQDGLLPGRQGIGLKLRHLIHRSTRAAVLTGLDSATQPTLLQNLVSRGFSAAPFTPDIEGPSARSPTPALSAKQMGEIINQEVAGFVRRLGKLEDAFRACLSDGNDGDALTPHQVRGLMSGRYGEPVSWDMICAQSRWYGLRTPIEPSSPTSPSETAGQPKSPSAPTATKRLRTILKASPVTNDSNKYHVERVVQSGFSGASLAYAVPPLKSNLVALVYDDAADPKLVSDPIDFLEVISAQKLVGKRLGLLFDRTNFFSPCGGQASDVGFIKSPLSQKPVFQVSSVEKITENDSTVSSKGWVIHWVTCCEWNDEDLPLNSLILCPDSQVRLSLMQNHTAQHLLNWAFSVELPIRAAWVADAERDTPAEPRQSATTIYHGSRVGSDRYSIRLTLLETPEKLEAIVERVEARCRAAIEAKLPIVCQEMELADVVEKSFVKRFAWESYPQLVRVVCIGGDIETIGRSIDSPSSLYSAELCGGTHVHQTNDLVDVVIVGLRSRNQAVKEGIIPVSSNPPRIFFRPVCGHIWRARGQITELWTTDAFRGVQQIRRYSGGLYTG
uniref:alanine--tRNA ligase n=1 Tax=Mesocestoides corti TaxID=53468 RepID=A0A5K3FPT6_MESCO